MHDSIPAGACPPTLMPALLLPALSCRRVWPVAVPSQHQVHPVSGDSVPSGGYQGHTGEQLLYVVNSSASYVEEHTGHQNMQCALNTRLSSSLGACHVSTAPSLQHPAPLNHSTPNPPTHRPCRWRPTPWLRQTTSSLCSQPAPAGHCCKTCTSGCDPGATLYCTVLHAGRHWLHCASCDCIATTAMLHCTALGGAVCSFACPCHHAHLMAAPQLPLFGQKLTKLTSTLHFCCPARLLAAGIT